MTDTAAGQQLASPDLDRGAAPVHIPRASVSYSAGEQARIEGLLEARMTELRRAEDTARHAGHAFHRARRDVVECQRMLAEAAARLRRVPGPGYSRRPGSA
jgi:hypothetical protein